ncbi:hypothetical protein RUM43_011307 [Polyplax serrata]|uniref:Uncharacterized protein n=1 Tax=Polyplax serrata TaxID=468196 RepID=A0AAN8S3L9_POLSC
MSELEGALGKLERSKDTLPGKYFFNFHLYGVLPEQRTRTNFLQVEGAKCKKGRQKLNENFVQVLQGELKEGELKIQFKWLMFEKLERSTNVNEKETKRERESKTSDMVSIRIEDTKIGERSRRDPLCPFEKVVLTSAEPNVGSDGSPDKKVKSDCFRQSKFNGRLPGNE